MPDANLAIQNHHAEMVLWWKKPIYKKARIEFCKRNRYLHRPAEEVKRSEDRKEAFKQLVKQSHSIQNARRRKFYQEFIRGGKK